MVAVLSRMLKQLATSFSMAVLTTNHMVSGSRPSLSWAGATGGGGSSSSRGWGDSSSNIAAVGGGGFGEAGSRKAALGEYWKGQPSMRVQLSKPGQQGSRLMRASVVTSPMEVGD